MVKEHHQIMGLIKVNQKISGSKFGNMKDEISGRVRNWVLKTWVLKPKKNRIQNP